MVYDAIKSDEACRLIRQLEQLLEQPVMTVVLGVNHFEVEFVLPAEAGEAYVRDVLATVGKAAQDALKSL